MGDIRKKLFGSPTQFLITIALSIGGIAAFALYDPTVSMNKEARKTPIAGVVTWEKKLCGKTICSQEITVSTSKGKLRVVHKTNNFYSVGDQIELVRVRSKKPFPSRVPSGQYSTHYEIYEPNS